MNAIKVSSVLCAAALGVACAGAPKPTDQLVRAEGAVRTAEELGARNVPRAELHQKLAKDQLDKARKLMADDENARAKSTLERARADAELAVALTREEKAAEEAKRAEAALTAAQQKRSETSIADQGSGSR